MAETHSFPSTRLMGFALFSALAVTLVVTAPPGYAQTSDGVMANLGALDDLDPMTTVPHLLMPSATPTRGRVVLRPPAGVDPITSRRSRVVLRPPPGTPSRITSAPTIAVPPPAAPVAAPPTSVTSTPPPPVAAPVAAVAKAPLDEPVSEEPDTAQSGPAIGPAATAPEGPQPSTAEETADSGQTASLPPADGEQDDQSPITIIFGTEETDIPDTASSTLNELASLLIDDTSVRVQLMAYASSADGSPSSVRRKSLSRALSIRAFLMDQGIQATRIEVRALGDQNEGGNPDRVDAVIEQR